MASILVSLVCIYEGFNCCQDSVVLQERKHREDSSTCWAKLELFRCLLEALALLQCSRLRSQHLMRQRRRDRRRWQARTAI
ncbi:hypothetical protein LOK49_LG08G01232 [Camellia lanceoleosa]|uniref:Uncharacterized protein n=1 Tax=Camellia lanceoleosa TaxID=1840588 RepID=A0ACC0GS99_9ERIC|nr:hypothetical protein LOK49_Contig286G00002 [Camellia lanceoleosa]KAI8003388.1 hypothetical protein LOK49_LG08G01232 [Camellia lanceoleosa]